MEIITWLIAEGTLLGGQEVEARTKSEPAWRRFRVQEGVLEVQDVGGVYWARSNFTYNYMTKAEWRHVPKQPSVHELSAKWRSRHESFAYLCANELEETLKRDEMVSLKGVEIDEVERAYEKAYLATQGAFLSHRAGCRAILEHLKARKT